MSTTLVPPDVAALPVAPAFRSFRTPRRRRTDSLADQKIHRALLWLSGANLVAVLGVFALICVVSEHWWLSAALSYLPRLPWMVPAVLLGIASAVYARWMILPNVLAIVLVAAPIMGFTAPMSALPPAGESAVRLVSSNIQFGSSRPQVLSLEIERLHPDIVLLQEAHKGTDEFAKLFQSWHRVHVGEFLVASPYPVRLVEEFHFAPFERRTAILCEVDLPTGPVRVCNVHLNTPRWALGQLQWHSLVTGAGVDVVQDYQTLRNQEAAELRDFVEAHAAGRQLLVAGDFNTPALSSTLSDTWNGYTSAFDAAGTGYGYTSPCNTNSRWPSNTPWVRIDHVLCGPAWRVHAAGIGSTDGSDHRLIYAVVTPDPV